MRVDIITLMPEIFTSLDYGIPGIAQKKGAIKVCLHNPRDFTKDKHKTVDDKPFGGGPGMVMKVEPLRRTIAHVRTLNPGKLIYLSPQGKVINHAQLARESLCESLILLCGRYEGIDERIIQHDIDEEWSIGDYVLSGGEFPALVITDALARLLPGVLGHDESNKTDSFCSGLLDHPHYTRPESVDGQEVPNILLSGDHAAIKKWRKQQSLGNTWLKKPALFNKIALSREENVLLQEFQKRCSGEKS